MKKIIALITILFVAVGFTACSKTENGSITSTPTPAAKEITVSAAASLKTALDEIKPLAESEKNIKLTINYGASGTLQKQIEEGAPVDVFISAGKKQVDTLSQKKLIDDSSRFDLLANKLVMIVSNEYKDKIKSVEDIADLNVKIGIGTVESVPAGQYAQETLTNLKLWDKIKDKIVFAKDVTQVVTYVESGNTAAGIVYNSDATGIKSSSIAQVFDDSLHKPIVYPAAIVSESKEKEAAQVLLDYLKSDKVQDIFIKYGFNSDVK